MHNHKFKIKSKNNSTQHIPFIDTSIISKASIPNKSKSKTKKSKSFSYKNQSHTENIRENHMILQEFITEKEKLNKIITKYCIVFYQIEEESINFLLNSIENSFSFLLQFSFNRNDVETESFNSLFCVECEKISIFSIKSLFLNRILCLYCVYKQLYRRINGCSNENLFMLSSVEVCNLIKLVIDELQFMKEENFIMNVDLTYKFEIKNNNPSQKESLANDLNEYQSEIDLSHKFNRISSENLRIFLKMKVKFNSEYIEIRKYIKIKTKEIINYNINTSQVTKTQMKISNFSEKLLLASNQKNDFNFNMESIETDTINSIDNVNKTSNSNGNIINITNNIINNHTNISNDLLIVNNNHLTSIYSFLKCHVCLVSNSNLLKENQVSPKKIRLFTSSNMKNQDEIRKKQFSFSICELCLKVHCLLCVSICNICNNQSCSDIVCSQLCFECNKQICKNDFKFCIGCENYLCRRCTGNYSTCQSCEMRLFFIKEMKENLKIDQLKSRIKTRVIDSNECIPYILIAEKPISKGVHIYDVTFKFSLCKYNDIGVFIVNSIKAFEFLKDNLYSSIINRINPGFIIKRLSLKRKFPVLFNKINDLNMKISVNISINSRNIMFFNEKLQFQQGVDKEIGDFLVLPYFVICNNQIEVKKRVGFS